MSARRRVPGICRSSRYLSPRAVNSRRTASSQGVSRRGVTCMRRRTSADDASGLFVFFFADIEHRARDVEGFLVALRPDELGAISFQERQINIVQELGVCA
jgi:hypothetical protein